MKKINIYTLILFFTVGFLTSCLQDTEYTDIVDSKGNNSIVSIYGANFKTVGVKYTTEQQEVPIFTITAGRNNFDEVVKFSFDPSKVAFYNDKLAQEAIAHGDTTKKGEPIFDPYELLPEEYYIVPELSVSVPKGQLDADFKIIILNSSIIPLKGKYILPFNIESISGDPKAVVAENLKEIAVRIVVKNDYEANYAVTGFFFHPSSMRDIKATKYISTIDKTTCQAPLGDLGGSNYHFKFVVGEEIQKVSLISNWTASGVTPGGSQSGFMKADNPGNNPFPTKPGDLKWNSQIYSNIYKPDVKTFWMHYGYGGGASSANGWTRQVYEKWVRLDP